jgi:hypothetical protein
VDPRDVEKQTGESPEETIALTRRLLARSRATLDGMDQRLGAGKGSEMKEPPTRDAAR